MSTFLKELLDKSVSAITNDGKCYFGVLKACDQHSNIVLNDAEELVLSMDSQSETVPLGLFLIKGDNLALLGEVDPSNANIETFSGEKLGPIVH